MLPTESLHILPLEIPTSNTDETRMYIKNVLDSFNVDRSKWGIGNAKTEEEFIKEIIAGERYLGQMIVEKKVKGGKESIFKRECRLTCSVNRIAIDVSYTDENGEIWYLTDGIQIYDKTHSKALEPIIRERNLREKLKGNESQEEALVRALDEETGGIIKIRDKQRFRISLRRDIDINPRIKLDRSNNYPSRNLLSFSTTYYYSLNLSAHNPEDREWFEKAQVLPTTYFIKGTRGYIEDQKQDKAKVGYVYWRKLDQASQILDRNIIVANLRRSVDI